MRAPVPDLPPLRIGDFAPTAILQDHRGETMAFHHQHVAGHPVIVLLCRDEAMGALESARDRHAEIADADTRVLAISRSPVADNRALAERHALPFAILADPRNEVLGRFGDAAIAVLDRNQRIAGLFGGADDLGAAVALCRRLTDEDPPGSAASHAPVLQVPGIFEPQLCLRLIDFWRRGDKRANEVTRGTPGRADYAARSDGLVKRRTDVLIPEDNNPTNLTVRDRLLARVVPEVMKAFQFRVRSYEIARIGCYDAGDGGYFRPHRDDAGDPARPRRFALSVNLNDGFDGGGLCFPEYGRRFYVPRAGGGVVFSCNLLHEAQPVTRGQRFGLFTFLR
jgi:peroxiredoxin/predicted 2-oxoglutarate/Fe(II)-dependent dioxygenase YbiX